MIPMKRILTGTVAGMVLMGSMGAVAQNDGPTYEEIAVWLEENCIRSVVDGYGDFVSVDCYVFPNGDISIYIGDINNANRPWYRFSIRDVDVEIGALAKYQYGFSVIFTCHNGTKCVRWRFSDSKGVRSSAVLPITNYSESGHYTEAVRQLASNIAREFLYYQALIAKKDKDDLY